MIVNILRDPDGDRDRYLGEMLSLWGGAWWQLGEIEDESAVLVAPPGRPVDRQSVAPFLAAGGHLILIVPAWETLQSLGIDYPVQYGDDGSIASMRLVTPLLHTFSHHAIPIVGRRMMPVGAHYSDATYGARMPVEARVWAYQYESGPEYSDRPAVFSVPVDGGTVTVFTYDLVECYRDLRQGRPRYQGWRPASDDICRPAHLFGPHWQANFHSVHLPLADFHPLLLLHVIEETLATPLPRFWQLPGTHHSAILISGDEDAADPEHNEQIFSFLESIKAFMTIYIQMQGGQSSRARLDGWMKRGHHFSVHPYPMEPGESGMAPSGSLAAKLERCVAEFSDRYGLPPRIIRNHRMFWTGYTEIPRLWQRLGVEMDTNYVSGGLLSRGFSGYYSAPAASLPLPFLDENWNMIDVLQQPVCASDDAEFHPGEGKSKKFGPAMFESYGQALLENNLRPLGLPFGCIFHPVNFDTFAREQEERFLKKAHASGTLLISDHQWLDFWKLRASCRIESMEQRPDGFRFVVTGDSDGETIALSLPVRHRGRKVSHVSINGAQVAVTERNHIGEQRLLVRLPASSGSDRADKLTVDVTV